jgi:hypothetical protein
MNSTPEMKKEVTMEKKDPSIGEGKAIAKSSTPKTIVGKSDDCICKHVFKPQAPYCRLDPNGPFRALDYRWQLALRRANDEPIPEAWKDAAVRVATRFICELAGRTDEFALLAARRRFPALVDALTIRLHPRPSLRWEIEARVLARQSPDEIATAVGNSSAVIEMYEQLFFAVRDRLSAAGWIQHAVIRSRDPDANPTETAWKHYAYTYGPRMLDAIIGLTAPSRPRGAFELANFFRQMTFEELGIRAAVAAYQMPVGAVPTRWWMEVFAKTLEIDRSTEQAASLTPNIRAMLDGLSEQFGRSVPSNERRDELAHAKQE